MWKIKKSELVHFREGSNVITENNSQGMFGSM